MAKKKFYAVKKGKNPGIYETWDEAKEQVTGFPSPTYKSFNTKEEAEEFLYSDDKNNIKLEQKQFNSYEDIEDKVVVSFVSGGTKNNDKESELYSFSAYIATNDGIVDKLYKSKKLDTNTNNAKNFIGEIEAIMESIKWAIDNNKKKIYIKSSYEGVKNWATGEWKPKNKIAIEYKNFFDEKNKLINIEFINYNNNFIEENMHNAANLAKDAFINNGSRTYQDGSVALIGISKNDWENIVSEINSKEDVNAKIVDEKKSDNNKISFYIVDNGDKLRVNCYGKHKSYIQGKNESNLYHKIVYYALDKIKSENEVISILNTYHGMELKDNELEIEFNKLLPDFPKEFSDQKFKKIILSAVFNSLYDRNMPEYTCLVTPLFRSYEYYLHRILNDKMGENTEKPNGSNNFSYFKKVNNRYYYNGSKKNLLKEEQLCYLEDLYNNYNRIRHPHSHWNQYSIDSKTIEDLNEAKEILTEGLKFINKYYILF